MLTSDFDFELPPDRIAQEPLSERDASKLLVLDRSGGNIRHAMFRDLPSLLRPGDLLVLNDTRVIPARVFGLREETGGNIEVVFLEPEVGDRWRALTRSGGKLRVGEYLKLADGRIRVRIVERCGEAGDILAVSPDGELYEVLGEVGRMPVPPYITRDSSEPPSDLDRDRYQTIYARERGAVAAPTAGLHFTDRVFSRLDAAGVERVHVTLHVGAGTFKPVKADRVEDHSMDAERYEISPETADAIAACRSRSGRVIAVGTTVVRTLESAAAPGRNVSAGSGRATLFMTPGYEFKVVDAMLTNFHMPKGTPLMLVSALAGRERVIAAYGEALEGDYRFLSYGDSMLIL